MEFMCAKDEVHKWKALIEPFGDFPLLHHASAYADQKPRFIFLPFFERTDVAKHPFFRMFPHTAGVEKQQIRLLF